MGWYSDKKLYIALTQRYYGINAPKIAPLAEAILTAVITPGVKPGTTWSPCSAGVTKILLLFSVCTGRRASAAWVKKFATTGWAFSSIAWRCAGVIKRVGNLSMVV